MDEGEGVEREGTRLLMPHRFSHPTSSGPRDARAQGEAGTPAQKQPPVSSARYLLLLLFFGFSLEPDF